MEKKKKERGLSTSVDLVEHQRWRAQSDQFTHSLSSLSGMSRQSVFACRSLEKKSPQIRDYSAQRVNTEGRVCGVRVWTYRRTLWSRETCWSLRPWQTLKQTAKRLLSATSWLFSKPSHVIVLKRTLDDPWWATVRTLSPGGPGGPSFPELPWTYKGGFKMVDI